MNDATKRKRSYAMGYLTSICGPVVSFPDKQPTAYSYNGVVLPKLPEAPKGHEFILLDANSSAVAFAYYSTKPLYLKSEVNVGINTFRTLCAKEDGEYIRYHKDITSTNDPDNFQLSDGGAAVSFVAGEGIYGLINTSRTLRWANYDVRKFDDDSIWLAASDPEPIYE